MSFRKPAPFLMLDSNLIPKENGIPRFWRRLRQEAFGQQKGPQAFGRQKDEIGHNKSSTFNSVAIGEYSLIHCIDTHSVTLSSTSASRFTTDAVRLWDSSESTYSHTTIK
jgi:hypothetical protein